MHAMLHRPQHAALLVYAGGFRLRIENPVHKLNAPIRSNVIDQRICIILHPISLLKPGWIGLPSSERAGRPDPVQFASAYN